MLNDSRPAPTRDRLRVAVLTTTRAPGLSYLIESDPQRGELYDLVTVLATDPASEVPADAEEAGIPAETHDLKAFCTSRGARKSDLAARHEFDAETVRRLAPFRPDLIALSGYLHVLTRPMLEAFPDRILNLHDADLTIVGLDGRPRYRGLRSTFDALAAGEPETCSTVHVVTPDVDVGPLLVRSWPFPVSPIVADARRWGATDILKACAFAQREWMMRACWGPLLGRALQLIALNEVRILAGRAVIGGLLLGPERMPAAAFAPPARQVSGY